MRYEAATSSPGRVTHLKILGAQKLHHFDVRVLLIQVFFFRRCKEVRDHASISLARNDLQNILQVYWAYNLL